MQTRAAPRSRARPRARTRTRVLCVPHAIDARNARAHQPHTLAVQPRSPTSQCALARARRRRIHVLRAAAVKVQEAAAAAAERGVVDGDSEDDKGESEGDKSVSLRSEFDTADMGRYFRTRDELALVAVSEPGPASLAYVLQPGLHGRAQVPVCQVRAIQRAAPHLHAPLLATVGIEGAVPPPCAPRPASRRFSTHGN
ncbi:hypothetical protein BJY52DRAFT_134442 [Lactarius psammicola]|nr:hypothetical protein BJY52DRAFT_134442 [Lactarius psammicola]